MHSASLRRAVILPLLALLVAACGTTTQAIPSRPPVVVPTAPSPTPEASFEPTPDPSAVAEAQADREALEAWVEENNEAESRIAPALADVLAAYDGKSWSRREDAVLAWQDELDRGPEDPEGHGCWGELATMYTDFYAEQADLADTLSLEIQDHYDGAPSYTIPGQLTPRQALRKIGKKYDAGLTGKLRGDAVAALCEAGDVTPPPAVPAPGKSSLVGGVRIGEFSVQGDMVVATLQNTTPVDQWVRGMPRFLDSKGHKIKDSFVLGIDRVVPANETVVAWTLVGLPGTAPKTWKRIAMDADVVPVPEGVAKGELSGQRAVRTSLGTMVSVTVTNTAVDGWCGAVTAEALRGGRIASISFQDMRCPKPGDSWRELVPLSKGVKPTDTIFTTLKTTGDLAPQWPKAS